MNPRYLNYFAIEVPDARAATVHLRQRNARVSAGSRAALYLREWKGVEFIGTADIEDVAVPEDDAVSGPVLKLRHRDAFSEARTLDEMAGSLSRIKDPAKAKRSFARQYVRLDYWDYERIRIRHIDVARTVFRVLYFSLPIALRVEFLQETKEAFQQGEFPIVDRYEELAERIVEYVREPVALVLKMGNDLQAVYSDLSVLNLPPIEALTMTNADGERPVNLGRASVVIHREGLISTANELDHEMPGPGSTGKHEKSVLPLGLPGHVRELVGVYLPDMEVEAARESLRRLEGRPWQESIL